MQSVPLSSGLDDRRAGAAAPGRTTPSKSTMAQMSTRSNASTGSAAENSGRSLTPRHIRKPGWSNAELFDNATRSFGIMTIGEPGERAWFNMMLVFFPLAFIGYTQGWEPIITFAFALLAMMPLAERLGFCTEMIANHTNDTLGGLMNASMGNAPELIISIFALKDGLLRVVQVSLLGSILSNLLLVLGTGFLLGGIKHREQTFNAVTSHLNAGLLLLAVMCLLFPAVLVASNTEVYADGVSALLLSRMVAIVMLVVYCCFLVFQLRTHAHLFEDAEEEKAEASAEMIAAGDEDEEEAAGGSARRSASGHFDNSPRDEDEDAYDNNGLPPSPPMGAVHAASHDGVHAAGGGVPRHGSKLNISKRSLPAALGARPRSPSSAAAQAANIVVIDGAGAQLYPAAGAGAHNSGYAINIMLAGAGGGAGGAGHPPVDARRFFGGAAGSSTMPTRRHIDLSALDTDAAAAAKPTSASTSAASSVSGAHAIAAAGRRKGASNRAIAVIVEDEAGGADEDGAAAGAAGAPTSATGGGSGAQHLLLGGEGDSNYYPGNTSSTDGLIAGAESPPNGSSSSGPRGGAASGSGASEQSGARRLAVSASGSNRNVLRLASPTSAAVGSAAGGSSRSPRGTSTAAPGSFPSSLSPSRTIAMASGVEDDITARGGIEMPSLSLRESSGDVKAGGGGSGIIRNRDSSSSSSGGRPGTTLMMATTLSDTRNGASSVTASPSDIGVGVGPPRARSSKKATGGGGGGVVSSGAHEGSAAAAAASAEHEEEPPLGLWTAIAWLFIVTAGVAALSEVLVSSIGGAAASAGMSEMFVSAILLPIAGNAAEHASAVIFAYKNRLDISLGVAIGSSTQIALFVAPFCVIIGWCINQPLSFNFQMFETATVFATVLMVNFIIIDGKSNWMVGCLLIAGYVVTAMSFALHSGSGTV